MGNDQSIEVKLSQSYINKFCKMLSSEELKSIKQRDKNTKDVDPLSIQTNANCMKKRKVVSWKYTPKVNESNSNLEENVKQPKIKRIVLVNDKIESRNDEQEVPKMLSSEKLKSDKQTHENMKDVDPLSIQTSANCMKKREVVPWRYTPMVNESNSNLEENIKQPQIKRIVLIDDKIQSKNDKHEKTKDVDPLSIQTSANCMKKREVIPWRYTPKVNKSNSNLEENVKEPQIKRIVLIDDKIHSKNGKQEDKDTKDLDPLSIQTSANCMKKRKAVPWRYIPEVNESNSNLEENVKQPKLKRIVLINDKVQSINDKQEDENTKDVDPLSVQTSANCMKNREIVPWRYTPKVNESNSNLEENVKQPKLKRIVLINNKIQSISDKQGDENAKDVDPLSIRTSANCTNKRKVSWKYKVNESNSDLEENVKQPKIKRIVLINDKKESKNAKQEDENTKNQGRCSSRRSNASRTKNRKSISRKHTAKVSESNADPEEKQPKIVWVGSINDKEWTCKFCNKTFSSPNNFVDHECTVGKRYTCLLCFAEFTRNSSLNRHLKQTHDREKKHICDICGKGFSERVYLENHWRKHIGERPYLCDLCDKAFHSKLGLKYHIKTHMGDFKYACDYCPKKFLDKTNMLAHMTTHTGEKNHKCDVCGRRFGTMPALIHHKVVHSEAKTYMCPCGKRYKHKYSLRRHIGLEMCAYSQQLKLNRVEPDSILIPDNSNTPDI